MIGVRKNSGVIRLLMAAALVLFVAACSSSSDNSGLERERDQALEMVEELEGTVEGLTGDVDELKGQLATLQESGTDADQEKIDMLEERIAELEGIEQDVLDDAEKMKRASVLALYKGLDPDFNADGPVPADVFEATGFTLSVTHGKAAKVTPAADAADGLANNKLSGAAGMMSDVDGTWSSTVVSAQDSVTKDTDTVVVFTDIAADKTDLFEDVFTLNANNVLPADDPGGDIDNDSIASKYVAADDFPTDAGVTVHGENSADDEETIRYLGTYAGAAGVYTCVEDGVTNSCESQGTKDGVLLSDDWTFDPDGGAMAREADSEYAHFGWWWRVAADDTYSVAVFHGHNGGGTTPDSTAFNALTDTASYVGPAAGKFAISPQLPGTEVMGGHFTATATLSVDFEKGDNGGEISGSVHDFMQDDYELPFEVALPKADITISPTEDDFSGSDIVWSISGEKSGSKGTWGGDFHNQAKNEVPTTVTGAFAATYNEEVGRIEGAFGATRQ